MTSILLSAFNLNTWYRPNMKFTLLTHSREFAKRSNTGQLVVDVLGTAAEQVRWDRIHPPARLVEEIDAGGVALIYPGVVDEGGGDLTGIRQVILIDGTWQEARRIHQRSPYLQNVRRVSLKSAEKSVYNLRKNQKLSGLCTAECVIEILRRIGRDEDAERLTALFLAFITRSGAKVRQPSAKRLEQEPL
jgi:DTW domain-containing protein YfiP